MKKKFAVVEARLSQFCTQTEIRVVSKEEFNHHERLIKKILFESDCEQECYNAGREFDLLGKTYKSFPMTVKDLISYLQTLPGDAKLCTNNSRSWRHDVYNGIRTLEDIKRYIQVLDRAEINGDPIEGTFVSIHDSRCIDY